ncbi:MAG TPA: DinB family protein [Cyclobacteriaceae bacterium]|nr:DinB family protein [Cyclobacteriaceae bacterium]
MITRIWHGKTTLSNSAKYLEFLLNQGTHEYRQTPGNLSVKVWKKEDKDHCHFWTVTEWENLESLKAFAGNDFEKARYYPDDTGMLLEFEEHVVHYQSHDVSKAKVNDYIRQFRETYLGGSWQGESFTDKLHDISDETAFVQPVEGIHSIAEIIWHCIYWRNVLIHSIEGDIGYRDRTWEELNFLPTDDLKLKGWTALKAGFEKTGYRLVELLYNMKDDELKKEYKPGYPLEYLLEGVVQHDIYHLGQVGLVIAILKKRNLDHKGKIQEHFTGPYA